MAHQEGSHQLHDHRAHRGRRDDHAHLRLRLRLVEVRALPLRLSDWTTDHGRPSEPTAPARRRRRARRTPPTRRRTTTSIADELVDRRRRGRRATTTSSRRSSRSSRSAERRRPRRRRAPRRVSIDDELDDDDDAAARAEPVRPSRRLVRRAHVRGLREQGEAEPRQPRALDERRGADLRGRHPDGRRHRVQGRPQGRRAEEGVPRLPARAHGPRRRLLVRRAQHARCHRLRRQRRPAHAAVAQGSRGHPRRRQGRAGCRRRRCGRASSSRWASRCG